MFGVALCPFRDLRLCPEAARGFRYLGDSFARCVYARFIPETASSLGTVWTRTPPVPQCVPEYSLATLSAMADGVGVSCTSTKTTVGVLS